MATEEKWYFSKDHLNNTPSRQCGIDVYKELFYRQQAANFIQDMGQRLKVSQLCINTATVYMHRFYVFHSFTHFPWHSIAAAALFLSAKVEEQPRKLEHVIRVHNLCENPRDLTFDTQSERYHTQSQDLVFNENVLLQTLGFDVAIDHPHAHVVRCCHLVRASKDLAQTSYFMASTSLHLTTMCLQYKPTVVACFCIHLACKWSNWEIPLSNEKKEWFSYVDSTVTAELLQQLTSEFLVIFERCPSRLKEKIMAIGDGSTTTRSTSHVSSPFESEPRKLHPPADAKDPHHRLHHHEKQAIEDPHKHRSSRPPHESSSSSQQQKEREYREKKERERMAQHGGKPPMPSNSSSSKPPLMAHGHHRPPVDPQKMKPHSRHVMSGQYKDVRDPTMRVNDTTDSKEIQPNKDLVRSDKELDKRAFPMKQPVTDMNSLNNSQQQEHGDKRQQDSSRSRLPNDPKLLQHKQHESARRSHEDQKLNEKKHSSWYDNNKMYDKNSAQHNLKPTTNSTSQRTKSPFAPDTSKSVPKTSQIKSEPHNGSSNGGYGLNLLDDLPIKEEYQQQQKKPSMFSPEKTPPRKSYPTNNKRVAESSTMQSIPAPLSPLDDHLKRSRSSSNSSEGTKKVEQVEGFENILRESSVVKQQQQQQHHSVPENILHDNTDSISKELKPPEILAPFNNNSTVPLSQPIVNGIEINPTLISTLLKEAPSVPHLATITSTSTEEQVASQPPPVVENKESKEHHHKDRKKKNKEKHKHKDKSREEKEKKKKHKDKDKRKNKEKSSSEETPIKITISKIQPEAKGGLKIKIPKERLKTDVIGESSQAPVLKLKIPKVVISGQMGSETKKRDREKSSPVDGPPTKFSKTNYKPHGDKQNGQRSSYNKVSNFNNNSTRPHFNNNVPNNTFNAMAPMQNYYYNFPPPPVTQMHSMNVPPPFISYDPNIYGPMYASPYIYPTHGMYPTNQHMVGGGPNIPPPLPDDAPPDVPPPPPPE